MTKQSAKQVAPVIAQRRVRLEWSRLLGFDQAPDRDARSDGSARRVRLAKVGVKVGTKPGVKNT